MSTVEPWHGTGRSPAPRARHLCDDCGNSFQRREHLERHVRCHLQVKPFSCRECTKAFSRKYGTVPLPEPYTVCLLLTRLLVCRDTLQRHLVTHGYPLGQSCKRAPQACRNCTRSKQRCTGQAPCDRCSRRGLPCLFAKPTNPAVKSRVRDSSTPMDHGSVDDAVPATLPGLARDDFMGELASTEMDMYSGLDFIWNLPTVSTATAEAIDASDFMFYDFACGDSQEAHTYMPDNHSTSKPSSSPNEDSSHLGKIKDHGNATGPSFPEFPTFSSDELDLIISDDFCHVPELSVAAYDALLLMYNSLDQVTPNTPPCPRRDVINAFIQLYFEYFHPGFPLLHQATFGQQTNSTHLLLAVAAIGCLYSRVKSRSQCSQALLETLRHALYSKVGLPMPPGLTKRTSGANSFRD